MDLNDWEDILFGITRNTGDISTMMQYIKVAKYNNEKAFTRGNDRTR